MAQILGAEVRGKKNMIKCDIILLSYESPDLLKRCVESVLESTRVPSRLIIVDNASRDPSVAEYINSVQGNDTVTITKVFNEDNEGFARGTNGGMRLSDAEYVCLLNNDCEVTAGWLAEMIAVSGKDEKIGMVNPQSNTFGSRPEKGNTIGQHASALQRDKKGLFVELGHAIGFACLIKRELIDRIGYLDEAYEGVCYEDTDYSNRARQRGFFPVMAEGAYVYHVEQASRGALKGRKEIYRKNREIFEKKWGKLLRILLVAPSIENKSGFLDIYEMSKGLARQRAIVDIWTNNMLAGDISLDKGGIIKHADVGVKMFSRASIPYNVIWKVLTKKKKYDAVIMDEGSVLNLLKALKPIHRSMVFPREESYLKTVDGSFMDLKKPYLFARELRGGK